MAKFEEHQKEVRRQLPEAERVFAELKKEAGTTIHKPFEQWVRENPGVLEKLAREKAAKQNLDTATVMYKGCKYDIWTSLYVEGKRRIGWYQCWTKPVPLVERHADLLYDTQTKEVLAEKMEVGINRTGMSGPEFRPEWYEGTGGFYKYERKFWNQTTQEKN